MKSSVIRFIPFTVFLATHAGTVSAQGSEVTFVDGGYSELCEKAARTVDKSVPLQVTGSRLAVSPLELCTLAIRHDTSSYNRAGNYNNRGVLLFEQGRLEEALRDFEEAVRLQEDLPRAHVNRGFTLVAMERWEEAVEAFDNGIKPGLEEAARAHFSRAIAHEELGHVREAYQDYRKAAELDPEWEAPRLELTRFQVGGN